MRASEPGSDQVGASSRTADEISLQELYLVVRASAPWIALATFVVATAVFVYMRLLPPVYSSEATVVFEPPPISVRADEAFAASLVWALPFEAYSALAFDRKLLTDVLDAVEGVDWSVEQLLDRLALERRSPAQAGTLAIAHMVTASDAVIAATVARAWTDVTTTAARGLLVGSVDSTRAVSQRVSAAQAELEAAEDAWLAFRERDQSAFLDERESTLVQRVLRLDERRLGLELELVMAAAERDALERELILARGERSTLSATREQAYAGMSFDQLADLSTQRADEAFDAWLRAEERLTAFDAEHPIDRWQAELDASTAEYVALDARVAQLESQLAATRSMVSEAEAAIESQPSVLTLRMTLTDPSAIAEALRQGSTGVGEQPLALQDALNDLHVRSGLEALAGRRQIASLEVELAAARERRLELHEREGPLRTAVVEARRERRVLATVAQVAGATAQDLMVFTASVAGGEGEGSLIADGHVVEIERALRTIQRRVSVVEAELEEVSRATAVAWAELDRVRADLAASDTERRRVARVLGLATRAYDDVAALAPQLDVVELLAPLGVRVLSEAFEPARPDRRRALPVTLAAAAVTVFAGVVLVLMRQAIVGPRSAAA